jgi:hypothetical protein
LQLSRASTGALQPQARLSNKVSPVTCCFHRLCKPQKLLGINEALDKRDFTRAEGGTLGLIARESAGKGAEFLVQAKAEPGNIAVLYL